MKKTILLLGTLLLSKPALGSGDPADLLRPRISGQSVPGVSAFSKADNPLRPWYIGQQKGVVFTFANGTEVTYGAYFVAYKTKDTQGKLDNRPFGEAASYAGLDYDRVEFKRYEQTGIFGLLASPPKLFMGLAPYADGVLDPSMSLDNFRTALYKLGTMQSETKNELRLDQLFPEAFHFYYNKIRLEYDENALTHSEPFVITPEMLKMHLGPMQLSATVEQWDRATLSTIMVNRWDPLTWADKDPFKIAKRLEAAGAVLEPGSVLKIEDSNAE
jgi:hypothetical protein